MSVRTIGTTLVLIVVIGGMVRHGTVSAGWDQDGVAICTTAANQYYPRLVSDGVGGAIIVWYDDRSDEGDIYAQRIDQYGTVLWDTLGIPICTAAGGQAHPRIISDGLGGAVIAWSDKRNESSGDVYAQRVDAGGNTLWTDDGVIICVESGFQKIPCLVSDGAHGAIVIWADARQYDNWNIYAQRIDASGAVRWNSGGVLICTAAGGQWEPCAGTDGAGGAIVSWMDYRSGISHVADIYAQRVDGEGNILWTSDGKAICTAAGHQESPQLVSDGVGGAVIAWPDSRSDIGDVYAQRVNAQGDTLWTENGAALCTATGRQGSVELISDNAGGAIIAWRDERKDSGDIYARRVSSSGMILWDSCGVPICSAPGEQANVVLVFDGAGGAIIVWRDTRSGNPDIYGQRVTANGAVLCQPNDAYICTAAGGQDLPSLVSDGVGGAVIAWHDGRSDNLDIYAHRWNEQVSTRYDERESALPPMVTLSQNNPNPFNPSTTISFVLPEPERVQLTVYTVNGGVVRKLIDREMTAGSYDVIWNGLDERARQVASGIYLYTLRARSFSETKRMVLIK